jgi:hypothetical protein
MTIQTNTQHYRITMSFPTCYSVRKPIHSYMHGMAQVDVHHLPCGAYLHYTTTITGITFWYVSQLPF